MLFLQNQRFAFETFEIEILRPSRSDKNRRPYKIHKNQPRRTTSKHTLHARSKFPIRVNLTTTSKPITEMKLTPTDAIFETQSFQ